MTDWLWNGCLPDFPWWCDGILWVAVPLALIVMALAASLLSALAKGH